MILLSPISTLRVLVAYLGESATPPWWPTQFTATPGFAFLKDQLPRSWASGAVAGAVRAAREVHDQRIGKASTRHLFRFDGGLERTVRHEILHADQEAVRALVLDRETALESLRALSTQTLTAAPGPVQVGHLGQELSADAVADLAAHYLYGFRADAPIFPYFAGARR